MVNSSPPVRNVISGANAMAIRWPTARISALLTSRPNNSLVDLRLSMSMTRSAQLPGNSHRRPESALSNASLLGRPLNESMVRRESCSMTGPWRRMASSQSSTQADNTARSSSDGPRTSRKYSPTAPIGLPSSFLTGVDVHAFHPNGSANDLNAAHFGSCSISSTKTGTLR